MLLFWQVSQRRPIDSEPGCRVCLNKHLSFFCSAPFSWRSGEKGAPRMCPRLCPRQCPSLNPRLCPRLCPRFCPSSVPALSQAALEPWSRRAERSRAGPGREYKRAALYRSHSRLWSLSTMKNSYKLFPELNHLTSWHLVVFNFVTIGTVHSSQSQFFIL